MESHVAFESESEIGCGQLSETQRVVGGNEVAKEGIQGESLGRSSEFQMVAMFSCCISTTRIYLDFGVTCKFKTQVTRDSRGSFESAKRASQS